MPRMEPTPNSPTKNVWPTLVYADALGAIEFLVAVFGFEAVLVVPGESAGVVEHAQLRWPEGGGIMLGSAGREGNEFSQRPTGSGSTYVVTDELDRVYTAARGADAVLVRDMREEDYGGGSRGFSVRDPEGNIWSFGDYRGEA